MSILHGISAAILKNVSSVKKQASRLHKSSERIFGKAYTLAQCQEAVAVANGFRSWADVLNVSKRFSSSNEAPFWHLTERNDFQEKYLKVILQSRLSEVIDKNLFITGDDEKACELATSFWFERISFEKKPGLMVIDTNKQNLEDTAVGVSIQKMEIEDVMMRIRVIDTREKTLNVAISAKADYWHQAIIAQLPSSGTLETLQNSYQLEALEVILNVLERNSGLGTIGVYEVRQAAMYLNGTRGFINCYYDDKTEKEYQHEIDVLLRALDERKNNKEIELTTLLLEGLMRTLDNVECGTGISIWHESKNIPTIVLFDGNDAASSILAGVVYAMYSYHHLKIGTRLKEENTRPIFLYGDNHSVRAISQHCVNGLIFVNRNLSRHDAFWKRCCLPELLTAEVSDKFVSYSGRKISLTD
jgi:hypothetical protein